MTVTPATRPADPAPRVVSTPPGRLGRFWADHSGSMSYFAVAGALVMTVFGGIGIDMIHAELKRNKIQNTLDRAVLAAADLENMVDPSLTVYDYFRAMHMPDTLTDVTVSSGANFKSVTAQGATTLSSNFMQLIGVDSLQADGLATAEERVNKVEISLVIDISGSMADNQKMRRLQNASQIFLDTVLRDENAGLVSVSLVPYSEHVNPGPGIFDMLSVDRKHGFSHCIEFPDSEFASTALNTALTYQQMQHYQWNYFGGNDRQDTVCPQYDYETVTPFSIDREALKAQVAALQPRAGTSIFLGMKWGAALLDPSTQFISDSMINDGSADVSVAGRPVAFSEQDTIKTIVLMTDGQHDQSWRLQDWAYNSDSEIALWGKYNMWHYLVNNVHSDAWSSFYTRKYNAWLGDRLLEDICTAAKTQGIVIWAVGFEVTNRGADVMRNCASSPSHFFRVEGAAIEDAFYAIGRTINQLRLTQ